MYAARSTLNQVRILHAVFLLTQFLLVFVLWLEHSPERSLAREILVAFAVVSASNVLILGGIRSRHLTAALDILRNTPDDAAALGRWRMANIFGFTFAESVSLFGVALKFLGAKWNVAGLFFAAGILLLLLWTPRLDLPAQPE
ncbi:MAG: hypothetical protein LAN71_11775 [Acidobacteriia bacterium]|nr:hypothetical protein [Terriglobia bacterium]